MAVNVACLRHVSTRRIWSRTGTLCNLDAESLPYTRRLSVPSFHSEVSAMMGLSVDVVSCLQRQTSSMTIVVLSSLGSEGVCFG